MEILIDNLVSLVLLVLLQAVLGLDNLLYISLESKRAPADKQAMVRKLGIGIAVATVIMVGNISIPVSVLTGIIGLPGGGSP